MIKNILIIDDSALMRRVICDIIDSDERFEVADRAKDGLEAFDLLSRNKYDAVVSDVNMPRMTGLQLLEELKKYKISARVMLASTDDLGDAENAFDALELGALDFVHKPKNALDIRNDEYKHYFLNTLFAVANAKAPMHENVSEAKKIVLSNATPKSQVDKTSGNRETILKGKKLVAIASSTGGPKALQSVVKNLPADLDAPVLIVQHMPKGFTKSLAERLDSISQVKVKEACEGDILEKGHVYIAAGGAHMKVFTEESRNVIHYSDEPLREGVKPCANYMYESIADTDFEHITCVVLTGMGADGTQGIKNLKSKKEIYVITQNHESCVVYGMPKSVSVNGLSNREVPLEEIAQEIIMNVGVK